ncbi:hypothetical protein GTZ99_11425 [Novosphingobium sp. FSY-8]|uniref:DUF2946 family protein n=1 Tax=Novosphingobium ovatum TaxID=1908523 RepID=A0ABW9XF47_9SPHN|nr:hypothetical protein [Novosphingobium ovatum]
MQSFRAFFLSHRRVTALLVALALCMKALIPAGYMLGGESKTITVQICADSLGHQITKQIDVGTKDHGKAKADAPCAFTALTHGVLGGADPIQLALALLFILTLGFAPLLPVGVKRAHYLFPPLRGPPALA